MSLKKFHFCPHPLSTFTLSPLCSLSRTNGSLSRVGDNDCDKWVAKVEETSTIQVGEWINNGWARVRVVNLWRASYKGYWACSTVGQQLLRVGLRPWVNGDQATNAIEACNAMGRWLLGLRWGEEFPRFEREKRG